jgi:hypothetical protein
MTVAMMLCGAAGALFATDNFILGIAALALALFCMED